MDLLAPLGLELDAEANAKAVGGAEGKISVGDDPVALVVPTDEELLIAKDALALARGARKNGRGLRLQPAGQVGFDLPAQRGAEPAARRVFLYESHLKTSPFRSAARMRRTRRPRL